MNCAGGCGRNRERHGGSRQSLHLEGHKEYRCELEFPVPLEDSATLLKLLQLHLERHPPEAAVVAFTLRVEPAEPRRVQGGFFLPPTPPADKLQITLARIQGMVGKENVGTPVLLNTHRPDAFEMTTLWVPSAGQADEQRTQGQQAYGEKTLRLVMRLFRPALPARVRLAGTAPKNVWASSVKRRRSTLRGAVENFWRMVGRYRLEPRRMGCGSRRWRAVPHLLRDADSRMVRARGV